MNSKIKFCGITSLGDARAAVDAGAWAIGMIFWPGSPRRCDPVAATELANAFKRRAEIVGVFVNPTLDDVVRTADAVGLTAVQLHGDEGPSFCSEVARRSGARVIKAAQVSGPGDVRDLERFHVQFHLLDAGASRSATRASRETMPRGGTGETFDWTLLAERRSRIPLILSGGLTPGNVSEAVAVARPYAVDTASGTEAAPGRKDPRKLAGFFAAARTTPSRRRRLPPTPSRPPA